ncbi:unnamed protein product [Rhizophagus irregularis]|nr:unnamed protein product [Rhizophagus irregularis]
MIRTSENQNIGRTSEELQKRTSEIIRKSHVRNFLFRLNAGKTSEYFLQVVADISTRWNSSYYAWNRLIKIKSYIQMLIVELVNNENDNDAKKRWKAA